LAKPLVHCHRPRRHRSIKAEFSGYIEFLILGSERKDNPILGIRPGLLHPACGIVHLRGPEQIIYNQYQLLFQPKNQALSAICKHRRTMPLVTSGLFCTSEQRGCRAHIS
jgi:hypothetical protein